MSDGRTRRVVVIGGGLAGLAAACELSTLGCRVTLVERNQHVGGKMNVLREAGYSFDMGPTILTLPQVLRGILRRAGRRVEDYIDLINLSPQWRCHYEDGVVIDLLADVDAMAASLDAAFAGSGAGAGYRKFLAFSKRMMRLSEKVFYYRDLGGVMDMMKKPPKEAGVLGDALAMRMYSTVASTVHRDIGEPHVRQMCEHFMQYVGSSPFLAPAILSLIAAAQVDHGCWYSMAPGRGSGGTRCVAGALERLAREAGVEILTGAAVTRVRERGGKAEGVELADGRVIAADAVVSNCDVQRTYRELAPGEKGKEEGAKIARQYVPACSGVVLYLGLDRQYEHLAHHNFMFSADSRREFDDIYAKGIPARDPTLYVAAPSRTDPTQAPAGCEALYVLVHTAYVRDGVRWEGRGGLLETYRPVIIEKLKRFGMKDLERHIVVERALTPQGIESMYNAEGGAIYGLASHGKLRGGFKPRNRSAVLKGLYLAGGSVNPGPGVPMVLMSGVTAARAAAEDLGVRPVEQLELGRGIEGA